MNKKRYALAVLTVLLYAMPANCWFWPFGTDAAKARGREVEQRNRQAREIEQRQYFEPNSNYSAVRACTFNRAVEIRDNSNLSIGPNCTFKELVCLSNNACLSTGANSHFEGPVTVLANSTLKTGMFSSFEGQLSVAQNSTVKIGMFSKWPKDIQKTSNSTISTDYKTPALYAACAAGGLCLVALATKFFKG